MDDKNDTTWQYEVDSVQRHGTTAATRARRHGEVSVPEPSDNQESEPNEDNGKYDDYGIPKGV